MERRDYFLRRLLLAEKAKFVRNFCARLLGYALGAIGLLTVVNMLGVKQSKWTQNILTTAKFLGLIAVVVVGFSFTAAPPDAPTPSVETFHLVNAADASAAYDKVDSFYAEKTENAGMYTCYWVNRIEVMENIL